MAVGVAEASRDLVHLGLDVLEICEAEGMDRLGCLVEGGLHANREPVGRVTARRGRDARLLARLRLVVGHEEVAQAAEARVDGRLDRFGDSAAIAICHLRHRCRRMIRGFHGKQALYLLDRPAHRGDGRGPPIGDALGKGRDVLVDQGRVRGQPRQQLLETLRRVARLVLRDVGRPDLRA